MTDLIPTINEIVKFGLQPNLTVINRDILLERNLIKVYSLYFEINYIYDDTDFPDFEYPLNIRENIESNFKDFGYYKTVMDVIELSNLKDICIGDAIDDLTDITIDLLEIKWRIENNSLADGLWYFQFAFSTHTQQHILDLLNYMKLKDA